MFIFNYLGISEYMSEEANHPFLLDHEFVSNLVHTDVHSFCSLDHPLELNNVEL